PHSTLFPYTTLFRSQRDVPSRKLRSPGRQRRRAFHPRHAVRARVRPAPVRRALRRERRRRVAAEPAVEPGAVGRRVGGDLRTAGRGHRAVPPAARPPPRARPPDRRGADRLGDLHGARRVDLGLHRQWRAHRWPGDGLARWPATPPGGAGAHAARARARLATLAVDRLDRARLHRSRLAGQIAGRSRAAGISRSDVAARTPRAIARATASAAMARAESMRRRLSGASRVPAITAPVSGSRTSPTALTAISAVTTISPAWAAV